MTKLHLHGSSDTWNYIKYLLVHIRIDKFTYSWLEVSSSFASREICGDEYFLNPGMIPEVLIKLVEVYRFILLF